jgi:hypothetical protein
MNQSNYTTGVTLNLDDGQTGNISNEGRANFE